MRRQLTIFFISLLPGFSFLSGRRTDFCYVLLTGLFFLVASCGGKNEFPVDLYYEYDQQLPLEDSATRLSDNLSYDLYYVSFRSVHDKRVTGLLSFPDDGDKPYKVIILLHGLGDRKTVDYIEAGNQYFTDAGYAVLRLDIDNHGDRRRDDFDFDLTDGYKYWTRDLIAQTVFDLRRAVDFLETIPEIDAQRIGFFGISLGGMIGTIFCGVEDRVKVPVIVLAGGNLNLMFGMDALSEDVNHFLSFIDPINYVRLISPRPLLMINAENDEVVPPITSKLLFQKAGEPKEILWYPTKHRSLPVEQAYPDGIHWFNENLK